MSRRLLRSGFKTSAPNKGLTDSVHEVDKTGIFKLPFSEIKLQKSENHSEC